MFRSIEANTFQKPTSDFLPGPAPSLHWLPISSLVVDATYQRDMGHSGRANVKLIAERFEWSKFAPVVVASIEGGRYAIVDGQHRTTAALLRDIEMVPCEIILADRAKQAQAYAALNGAITKTTPHQLFHSKVAGNDPLACEVNEVCKIAGVFVTRHNKGSAKFAKGETQAIGPITRCLKKYGRDTIITALQCITQTCDGNTGWVKSTIIMALCAVLDERRDWRDAGDALLRAMDDFNFSDEWDKAGEGKTNIVLSRDVASNFFDQIKGHLETRLRTSLKARYIEKPSKAPPELHP